MLFAWIFAVILFSLPALADSCNTCTRDKDGVLSCTLLHCQQPETLLECDDTLQDCKGIVIKENACYRKMREAMRTMDKHLTTAEEAQKAQTLPIEDANLWHQAMRECAK
jgi:hypothetical protein